MKPQLSSRWKPGHVVRRDTGAGTYEEINSPMYDNAEIKVQRALLARPPKPSWHATDAVVVWKKS
jgi:hypothetical protein